MPVNHSFFGEVIFQFNFVVQILDKRKSMLHIWPDETKDLCSFTIDINRARDHFKLDG